VTKEESIRNKVIEVLSENWPLTAKQIYNKLQRSHGVSVSYQAVHKQLKLMLEQKMLVKKKTEYLINEEWIEKIQKNTEAMAQRIKNNQKGINLTEMNEGESVNLSFNGILDLGWFLIDKVMKVPNPEKKPGLSLWRFCYSLAGLEEKHLTGFKEACETNDWYMLIEEENEADKMFGITLKEYGVKEIKHGIKGCATKLSDKMILGDYIAEIVYPKTFRKLWEIQNRLPKQLAKFNLGKHIQLMRLPQPKMTVIVTKNKRLAEEYRKEYL
jgi:ribosome biogenesis protein Nip4